jgi:putative ABC transport system ATP-binding protein
VLLARALGEDLQDQLETNLRFDMSVLLKLENITKTYRTGDSDYQALKGISFEVEKGEMVAIIGPSGSGKSTTMHILGALDKPTTGKYILNGKDVEKLGDDELASLRGDEIGFVFQAFNLLPRVSVLDNVTLPLVYQGVKPAVRIERALKALEQVGLADKLHNKSNQISGGQIQRVAIARALVTNPSIILADEPTGNLDTKTSVEVMAIFQKMNDEGKTVLLITHEPDIAAFASRTITLKDGQILSDEKNLNRKIAV